MRDLTRLFLSVLSPYYGDEDQALHRCVIDFIERHRAELEQNACREKLKTLEEFLAQKHILTGF